jgi:hypothetical protein
VIDDAKVRDYLLAIAHPVGRTTAQFFLALGFRQSVWLVHDEPPVPQFVTAYPWSEE